MGRVLRVLRVAQVGRVARAERVGRRFGTMAAAIAVVSSVCGLSVPASASLAMSVPGAASESVAASAVVAASDLDDPSMGEYPAQAFAAEVASLPVGLAQSIARDLSISPAQFLAQAAAAADAADVVAELVDEGVDVLGSRLEGTTLVMAVASRDDVHAVESVGGVATIGDVDEVDISSTVFSPATDVSGGQGYAWSTLDSTTRQCSIGFTGYRVSDGRPVAVTAGHCTAGMASITGAVRDLVQSAPGASGSLGAPIGSPLPGASAFGGGFDGGLLALDAASLTARSDVVTWGGGTGRARSSASLEIVGETAAIAGANLCKSGSRTGWTCGVVRAVDRSVNVQGSAVNSILATTCVQPGDSGGAAVIGQLAVGIASSTSSDVCGSPTYFSAFFPMVSTSGGASVRSQFGSIWEPAFSVAPPSGSMMTVPGVGSSGSISGRITAPSSRTTVSLFVDGAVLATVSAESGTWSFPLSTVAGARIDAGSRVISVAASQGAWSRSSRVEVVTLGYSGVPPILVTGLVPADFHSR